jgi:hypothetical protein
MLIQANGAQLCDHAKVFVIHAIKQEVDGQVQLQEQPLPT